MTRPQPAHGWKRGVRLGVLVAVGALGFASRWQPIPRWSVLLAAATVPVVWAATGFESQRPGESGISVAINDDHIGPYVDQRTFQFAKHRAGLAAMRP